LKGSIMAHQRILDPMERISEVLFGLIMALTFTSTLGVAAADDIKVRTMLFAALGCNLAWGIIDAGLYLLARLNDRGRKLMMVRAIRAAPDLLTTERILSDALPPVLVAAMPVERLEAIRQDLQGAPEPAEYPALVKRDWIGASRICLLSFLSTFPIVIPFMLIGDVRLALRVSNVVAIVLLGVCGYMFGRSTGFRPWPWALIMIVFGSVLVGVAIALGG
jgi:hypothetical protein